MWEWPQTVHTNCRCGSGHKQYTLIVDVGVTHTPTTVVHKQYTKIVDVRVATNSTNTTKVYDNFTTIHTTLLKLT